MKRGAGHDHGAHGAFFAHGHGDSTHAHARAPAPSKALGWSLVVVLGFGVLEIVSGWASGSLALASDGVHMLTDAFALALAWIAQRVARRRPDARQSFGYERAESLAAFANGLVYLALLGFIVAEAVHRLAGPPPIDAALALPVAATGLVVNLVVLRLLYGEREDLNTRGALLHVIGDLAGSVIAIVAIGTAWLTGWTLIDPLLTMAVSVLLLVSTLRLLRDSAGVLMNATPSGIDALAVGRALQSLDGVSAVHDLHLWSMGGGEPALAAHLEVHDFARWPDVLEAARRELSAGFGITHVTLQPEARGAGGALERLRQAERDRDAAIRQVCELEVERDASRELALRFEREREEERRSLAQRLQSELGTHATTLRTLASTFEARLDTREPSLAQLAALMTRSADALFEAIRGLVHGVRPEALDSGGLPEGLRALVGDWRLREPGVRFELLLDPADDKAFGIGPAETEAAAHGIAAEALERAVRRARATMVIVSVSSHDGWLTLQVADDGPAAVRDPAALAAMRERAESLDGELRMGRGDAGMTELVVRLPWRPTV